MLLCVFVYVSPLPLLCHRYRLSYDVNIEVSVGIGSDKKSSCNILDLKNPYFRFASVTPTPPPGCHNKNPTDQFWSNDNKVSCIQILQIHTEYHIMQNSQFK